MKIDAYRRTYGVVPDMLSDAGLPEPVPTRIGASIRATIKSV
jgi:hypothetical protein